MANNNKEKKNSKKNVKPDFIDISGKTLSSSIEYANTLGHVAKQIEEAPCLHKVIESSQTPLAKAMMEHELRTYEQARHKVEQKKKKQ